MTEKPSLQRRQLGMELRRLREEARVTRDEAATALERDVSMISRVENGRSAIRLLELERLLDLYRITGEQRDHVLEVGRAARQTRRKAKTYVDSVPNWFRRHVALEAEATEIRSFQVEPVPGLLQTEPYMRALIGTAQSFVGSEEVERRIEVRLARQQLLTREDPPAPLFWFVLNETVLRRVIGGSEVMRQQLEHLLAVTKLPNVTLQVLPFTAGEHPAVGFSYSVLRFGEDSGLDVVSVDSLSGSFYPEARTEIEWYSVVFGQLQVIAASPKKSRRMIEEAAREYT